MYRDSNRLFSVQAQTWSEDLDTRMLVLPRGVTSWIAYLDLEHEHDLSPYLRIVGYYGIALLLLCTRNPLDGVENKYVAAWEKELMPQVNFVRD